MMESHYFTDSPDVDDTRFEFSVDLAGETRTVVSSAGVFSHNELDRGTRALLSSVDELPESGNFLDIGTGWGPIALTMGLLRPGASVYGVEVNPRARELCELNAHRLGVANLKVSAPEQLDIEQFDVMWSNPPIRIGKQALHEILSLWLPRLAPGGEAWLVVAKKLGADSLLPWIQKMLDEHAEAEFKATRVDTIKGFRILKIQH